MSFEIVKRSMQDFGGLVLPDIEIGPGERSGGLIEFTRERILARGVTEIVTVFVPNPMGGSSAVIGYPCGDTEQLAVGDVMVRVPAGYFAVFTSDGLVDDPVEDVWRQAELAAKEGVIDRAFTEEIEITRAPSVVELYISLE
ncbi:effector binding domain-containing protein [Rhodococcus sp. NPDC058514]|uniref:effector binding domain-containing protein n=1 Tax=unclassified Rhodococcus (in: high G+C Gram-positive bacteria) TaxID=192944 RepID=UPI00365101BF